MRYSKAEIALARRIAAQHDKEMWERACNPPDETIQEQMQRILDAPLQPSYGPTPPWWEQAIAEEDQGWIWVKGGGWMPKWLWQDMKNVCKE